MRASAEMSSYVDVIMAMRRLRKVAGMDAGQDGPHTPHTPNLARRQYAFARF